MEFKENLKQRIEKASHASGAAAGTMKGGYGSYEIGRMLFTHMFGRYFLYGLKALPYNPFALQSLDDMKVKFGRTVLKCFDCPSIAVLGELGWPAMTEVAGTQKFRVLLRLRNFEDDRLVRRALSFTVNTLKVRRHH